MHEIASKPHLNCNLPFLRNKNHTVKNPKSLLVAYATALSCLILFGQQLGICIVMYCTYLGKNMCLPLSSEDWERDTVSLHIQNPKSVE